MIATCLVIAAGMALSLPTDGSGHDAYGTRPPGPQRIEALSVEQIRRTLARRLERQELDQLRIPFEADDTIRQQAAEITRGSHGDHAKLNALRHHFRQQGFLQRYDRDGTRTAREVIRNGKGNCLSYANLIGRIFVTY